MRATMRCDCGFETVGDDVEKLTAAAQAHSRTCQGAQLSDEAIARLAGHGEPKEAGYDDGPW